MLHFILFCRLQVLLLCLVLLPVLSVAQEVKQITEHDLKALLSDKSDTLHIVSFWATWCKPCVKELPYFTRISNENSNSNVKVLLINVDFPEDTDTRLRPFLKRQKLPGPVLQMAPQNDQWINTVSTDWSGAIPATIIYNQHRGIYFFAERELSLAELQKYVSLNQTTKP